MVRVAAANMAATGAAGVTGAGAAVVVAAARRGGGEWGLALKPTLLLAKSNNTLYLHKKSIPNIGWDTLASKKLCIYICFPNWTFLVTNPQAAMGGPLALTRDGPEDGSDEWCGRRLRAAPVST